MKLVKFKGNPIQLDESRCSNSMSKVDQLIFYKMSALLLFCGAKDRIFQLFMFVNSYNSINNNSFSIKVKESWAKI